MAQRPAAAAATAATASPARPGNRPAEPSRAAKRLDGSPDQAQLRRSRRTRPMASTQPSAAAAASSPKSVSSPKSPSEGAHHILQPDAPDRDVIIEPDLEASSDGDSTYGGDGNESYTTSLTSSVLDFKYENGRRYNSFREGVYVIPNDEREQDRLDIVHHWYRMTLRGELFRAPIVSAPQNVLDIGTGTGIWAVSFADEFPSAEVIGTDLSPIQPTWVPPNVKFEIDDAESDWTFPPDSFDYIHLRAMGGAISDWDKLFAQAYKALKPGGWLELQEFEAKISADDGTIGPDSAIHQWQSQLDEASKKIGRRMDVATQLPDLMKKAGYLDVKDDLYKSAVSPWPKDPHHKELGMWGLAAMLDGIEGYSLVLYTKVLGWDMDRLQILLALVRKELRDKNVHSYLPVHFIYGQKPEEEPVPA